MSSGSTSVDAKPTITDEQKAKSVTAAVKAKRTREQGIRLVPLLRKSLRLAVLLFIIWLIGYIGFSLTWVLLGALVYTAVWEYQRVRKETATDTLAEDTDSLLARVDELPQWVYFPDVERAEWLNKIILKMWPFIGVYVKNLLINTVAPIINNAMPSRLTPFVFEMVDLGTVPPRVGGVKVYIDNVQRNEIMMDIEVMFAGDAKLKVSLHGLRAGVKDITITGVVRVILKPLVSKVPLIGGLSVYFLTQPNIDFELTDVANVLELPLISVALRTIVNDQIANYLVLPHKIPIPLIDTLEEAIFMIPKGVVQLTLIEARKLEKADIGFFAKSDPYCKIKVGRTSFQTKVVKNSISPVWNETFQFVVTSENPSLEIKVYDKDPNADDFLGRFNIDLSTVEEDCYSDRWLPLENAKSGEIHASLKWFNLSKDPASLEQVKSPDEAGEGTSKCVLMVIVDSIKNLPNITNKNIQLTQSSCRQLSPCVHLQIGNSVQKTSVKENAVNPKWEDEFIFMIGDPSMQELSIEVIDAGSKGTKPLGDRKIPLKDILSCSDMQISRPYGLRNSGPETSITLRLCLRSMPGVSKPSSSGKSTIYGIEVVSQLVWTGWEPGKEYYKNITLKNVCLKRQKVKFKAPKSCIFTTMYPQPVKLSAGNSFALPVTFRPLEKTTYEDCIEFETNEGSFAIPIKGLLPQYYISVPQEVQFGLCAVNDQTEEFLEVQNASELVTQFQVLVLEPFFVEKIEGLLQPFTSQKLNVLFQPKAATAYECNAVIRFGVGLTCCVNTLLVGVGKYPHLSVAGSDSQTADCETIVNFGTVPIGKTVVGWFSITNQSQVNASFKIDYPLMLPVDKRDPEPAYLAEQRTLDRVFHCKHKKGTLTGSSSSNIQVSFSPKVCGRTYVDYLYIQAAGCPTSSVVKCLGSCSGPEVVLTKEMLNFQMVNSGETITKAVDIVNKSAIDALFQFDIDPTGSVFKFNAVCGKISAGSQQTITVNFQPCYAMNYYRRVSCLIHNQGLLTLDLIGTCHTDVEKPAVLQPYHIKRFSLYMERELSFHPPEHLNSLLAEEKMCIDDSGALYPKEQIGYISTELVDPIPVMDEYFNDGYHSDIVLRSPHVSCDVNVIEFGNVACANQAKQQTISLTNHTHGKLFVHWTGMGKAFCVVPEIGEILPLKSASFQVIFQPDQVDHFYSTELEGYAQYKSLRDFCQTDDKTHFPPWCVTLRATGRSFQTNTDIFVPRFNLDPLHIPLSVVNEHDALYTTVLLTNTGSEPILYSACENLPGWFALKPLRGLVPVGGHHILVVKYSPSSDRQVVKHTFQLCFNDCEKYCQDFSVFGSIDSPEVKLENAGMLYFKPTGVGNLCTRQHSVQNVSRLPVYYEWKLKHADSAVLQVHPSAGVLQPNEIQHHQWYFKPLANIKYMLKPVLNTWSPAQCGYRQKDGKVKQFILRAVGEGASGSISSKETLIDVGSLVAGTVTFQHLTLVNDSVCSIYYKLYVDQSVCGPYSDDGKIYLTNLDIELGACEGVLAARASCDILLTIRPTKRVSYRWKISYTSHSFDGDSAVDSDSIPIHLCDVVVNGVHPTIAVTDAHSYGSGAGLSKKQLWNLFSLDNLNMFLDGDPSDQELLYKAPTKHSYERRPPVYTRTIVDFNFNAAPCGSNPCVVQLQLENNCHVFCEWAFLLPSDQQLELDYWAEIGEFDNNELHEMKVTDNKLFTVEPSKGKLLPGETCLVSFTYQHSMVGTDRLPVLLKLTHGREILLNFVGVTVDLDRPYVHFPSARHMFAPVPIGESRSPVQVYELYNGGAVDVNYEIDLCPLKTITQDNFGHKVFECLTPKGCIKPGHSAAVEWRFSPLEARTYMVDVKITIDQGDTAVVTFTGIGFDKRLMGSTMELTDISQQIGAPSVQSVLIPGQTCYLSLERISIGNLPLLASARRLVAITNTSTQHCVKYVWHVTNESHAQFLAVHPLSDVLQPGESAICKVSFVALGQPAFYDIDLICETIMEAEYNEYLQKLYFWESEQERQLVEFTVTDRDINADMRLSSPEERPSSGGRLTSLSQLTTSEADLSKYKTLPPIMKHSKSTEDIRRNQKSDRKPDVRFMPRPHPPKTFMLHLGITARTHDMHEFRQHFSDDCPRFYIDKTLCKSEHENDDDGSNARSEIQCCHQAEADALSLILQNIIRNLVDDTKFYESCLKLSDEKIPYFQQFATVQVPPKQPQTGSSQHSIAATSSSEQLLEDDVSLNSSQTESSQNSTAEAVQKTETDARLASKVANVVETTSVKSFHETTADEHTEQALMDQLARADIEEKTFTFMQRFKTQPEFGNFVETCLENTILNIVDEAFKREFNITARPRLVALPPRLGSSTTRIAKPLNLMTHQ